MSCEAVNGHRSPQQILSPLLMPPVSVPAPPVDKVNGHQFSLQTKRLQEEIIAGAFRKAEECAAKGTKLIHVTAHAICKAAYAEFKTRMEEAFATSVSSDLMVLTLRSRETPFSVDLKERVIKILAPEKS